MLAHTGLQKPPGWWKMLLYMERHLCPCLHLVWKTFLQITHPIGVDLLSNSLRQRLQGKSSSLSSSANLSLTYMVGATIGVITGLEKVLVLTIEVDICTEGTAVQSGGADTDTLVATGSNVENDKGVTVWTEDIWTVSEDITDFALSCELDALAAETAVAAAKAAWCLAALSLSRANLAGPRWRGRKGCWRWTCWGWTGTERLTSCISSWRPYWREGLPSFTLNVKEPWPEPHAQSFITSSSLFKRKNLFLKVKVEVELFIGGVVRTNWHPFSVLNWRAATNTENNAGVKWSHSLYKKIWEKVKRDKYTNVDQFYFVFN